jgi:hypothetical protein
LQTYGTARFEALKPGVRLRDVPVEKLLAYHNRIS